LAASRGTAILVAFFCLSGLSFAEELLLRNGEKIVGTIVDFEKGMFRVKTPYGFALVERGKVASVNFTPEAAKPSGSHPSEPKTRELPSAPATSQAEKIPGPTAPTAPSPAQVPAVPPVSRPLNEPLPARMEEHLEGSNYVNDTFCFAMYKPPTWKIYEGGPAEGRAVVAMGTPDEGTVLIVNRQMWSGKPDLNSPTIEAGLRRPYQDYQKLSETPAQLDGRPAVRRAFRGLIDGVEWHGVSWHVVEENALFAIIGLTSSEMYQFQQAVIDKVIRSFRFQTGRPEALTKP
jgi:hypothetical protein